MFAALDEERVVLIVSLAAIFKVVGRAPEPDEEKAILSKGLAYL